MRKSAPGRARALLHTLSARPRWQPGAIRLAARTRSGNDGSPMRLTSVMVCLVMLLVGPVACAHWVPAAEHVTQAEIDPASAYAAALKVASERGYTVLEQKDAERSAKLRA